MNNTTLCAPFQLKGCGPTFGFSNGLWVGRAWGENQSVEDLQSALWNESMQFISLPSFSLFDLQLTSWGQVYLWWPCWQCSIMPPPFSACPNIQLPQLQQQYGATSTGCYEPAPMTSFTPLTWPHSMYPLLLILPMSLSWHSRCLIAITLAVVLQHIECPLFCHCQCNATSSANIVTFPSPPSLCTWISWLCLYLSQSSQAR